MAAAASYSANIPSRPTYSCIRCVERKVKCDRKTPCNACTRYNVECVFNPLQPRRNKKRLTNQNLADRLQYYEALLRERGIDPKNAQHVPDRGAHGTLDDRVTVPLKEQQLQASPSVSSESRQSIKARVIQGVDRSKLIGNVLWTEMAEELHSFHDVLGNSTDAEDLEASDDDLSFVLGGQVKSKLESRHPVAANIHLLWRVYIENIDPLTKIVHVPTLRSAIEKAASNIEAIPRSLNALMFAIYSAAVMSLTDIECRQRLNEPRKALLSRYISATKKALSCCKFMETTSIVVLQALIIYLLAVRDIYEPRALWSLTGVAVRVAQGMGLERDGVYLGLSTFETEARRRIWWQLKMHDFRTAELCGIGKFQDLHLHIGAECTKWPSNTDDDQLYPGMVSVEDESDRLTDAVFVSLKCELLNNAASGVANLRQQGKTFNPWDPHTPGSDTIEGDEACRDIEELLETKYLRYCDPSQPLHLMAMLMARCSINVIRLMSHHPRRWANREQTPLTERQQVWEICLRLLEQNNMLQSSQQLKRFAWHAAYFQQWHAVIHVLDTLRADPLHVDADRAWAHIDSMYANNPDLVFDMRKPIHVAVGNLCLKAHAARETMSRNRDASCGSAAPHYIIQLRQQQEAFRSRRGRIYTENNQADRTTSANQTEPLHPQASPSPPPTNDTTDPDPFHLLPDWLTTDSEQQEAFIFHPMPHTPDIGDGFVGRGERPTGGTSGHGDITQLDLDMLVSWEQWDAWLARSNAVRPLWEGGG